MQGGRIPLGRAAGIPVGAHWSVLAIFGLITIILGASILPSAVPDRSAAAYGTVAVIGAIVFLASLLAHELAHALVAQSYGVKVTRITLWLLGGVAELAENPRTPRAEFRIAVVGPLASLGVAVAAFGAAYLTRQWFDPLVLAAIIWLGLVNAIVAVFNMLPGAPLDGGRVLRAFLWRRSGDREQASLTAASFGRALGFGFIVLGLVQAVFATAGGLWLVLIGWFMLMAAAAERTAASARQQFAGLLAKDVMTRQFDVAPEWWQVETFLTSTPGLSRGGVFPVVSYEGQPVGVVSLEELVSAARDNRAAAPIRDVARELPDDAIVGFETDLGSLVTKVPLRFGRDLVAVMDGQRLAGVITPDAIVRHASRRHP